VQSALAAIGPACGAHKAAVNDRLQLVVSTTPNDAGANNVPTGALENRRNRLNAIEHGASPLQGFRGRATSAAISGC